MKAASGWYTHHTSQKQKKKSASAKCVYQYTNTKKKEKEFWTRTTQITERRTKMKNYQTTSARMTDFEQYAGCTLSSNTFGEILEQE